jgi:hypothetical protein
MCSGDCSKVIVSHFVSCYFEFICFLIIRKSQFYTFSSLICRAQSVFCCLRLRDGVKLSSLVSSIVYFLSHLFMCFGESHSCFTLLILPSFYFIISLSLLIMWFGDCSKVIVVSHYQSFSHFVLSLFWSRVVVMVRKSLSRTSRHFILTWFVLWLFGSHSFTHSVVWFVVLSPSCVALVFVIVCSLKVLYLQLFIFSLICSCVVVIVRKSLSRISCHVILSLFGLWLFEVTVSHIQ